MVRRPSSARSGPKLIVPWTVISRFQTRDQSTPCLPAPPTSTSIPVGRSRCSARSMVSVRPTQSNTASTPCSRIGVRVSRGRSTRPPSEAARASTAFDPDGQGPGGARRHRRGRAEVTRAQHDDVEVGVQHPQGGRHEQADRPGPDDHDAVAATGPLQRGVQRDGRGLTEDGPGRGDSVHGVQLGLVGHDLLAPATTESGVESQGRCAAAGGTGLVEALAGVRESLTAGPTGLEAAMGAREHRVDHDPLALGDRGPGAGPLHDRDHLVPGDLPRGAVERREHERGLGVGDPDIAAADPGQLGAQPDPPVGPRQRRHGRVGHEAEDPARVPIRPTSRPRGAASARLRSAGSAGWRARQRLPSCPCPPASYRSPARGRVSRSTRDGCGLRARASFMARM